LSKRDGNIHVTQHLVQYIDAAPGDVFYTTMAESLVHVLV